MGLFRNNIAHAPLARLLAFIFVFVFTSHYPLATNHSLFAAPVELDYMEYTTTAAAQAAYISNSSVTATGGTITEVNGYRIHTFTTVGISTFTINVSTNIEVLVIGGGAGGNSWQGGGGAGGYVYNISYAVVAQTYTVKVGNGGAAVSGGASGNIGVSSFLGDLLAYGGGVGPSGGTSGTIGSGGGASTGYTGQVTTSGQGNNGGNGNGSGLDTGGGGGGGAGAVGSTGTGGNGGNGGAGIANSITGATLYYCGGGAGGYDSRGTGTSGGTGGSGIGGNGAAGGTAGSGAVNTGSGGGGSGYTAGYGTSGAGGSGIVIVRYFPSPVLQCFSENSIKTQGSYSLKASAASGVSINQTLTRTVSPTIDLSDKSTIKFDIRSTRTGSNIKIGIRDSGGTTTYITPNITAANEYQTVEWDISSVPNSDKDAIDRIIIQIVNADAANTFYIDNLFADAVPPAAPAIERAKSISEASIEWNWQDNSSGDSQEDGFKVYSSTGGLLTNRTADTTFWIETGLKRNKEYARYVRAYNAAGEADSSTVTWRTKPGAFQSKTSQGSPTRTGPNAFGFVGDANWEWDVPVKAGAAITITAYIRYNSDYGAASKPKLTLSGKGISPTSVSATGAAQDAWELLTLNPGTPTENAILTLKAEGFSNTPGAKFFIDDINISQ